jgi:AhpD family alkylhydroperoxidase
MSDCHYPKNVQKQLGKFVGLKAVKEVSTAWGNFSQKVFQEGELSAKTKELIAVSCAHTRCPYCIETHVKNAKNAGATDEEIGEAILVAIAMSAGASLAHSFIAMDTLGG